MNQHDRRAQGREASEPEEGTRAIPKIVLAWMAILIVWGVGYYAWQIGKPLQGGDSRTPVATEHQEQQAISPSAVGNQSIEAPGSAQVPGTAISKPVSDRQAGSAEERVEPFGEP